ncbi:hypothetical protein ACTWPT_44425 [Nonomuraea sp. 3N208]|uniref:hypothetical protein n=1 Tax=Nonomuraea sp. 3N208 TaxID=3457421 RepID=UPI003FD22C7E
MGVVQLAPGVRAVQEQRRATMAAAETFGLDSPVGQPLAKTAAFLERVSLDMIESADRRRTLLT